MSVFKMNIYHKLKLSYIVVIHFWIPTPKKKEEKGEWNRGETN